MGLVDIQHHCRVGAADINQPVNVGVVAVHRVDALDDDKNGVIPALLFLNQTPEMVSVVVAEPRERGSRQPDAVDDAGMYQAVSEDEGLAVGESLDETCVGVVTAVEQQGRAAVKFLDGLFERRVIALVVDKQTRGRRGHRDGVVGDVFKNSASSPGRSARPR